MTELETDARFEFVGGMLDSLRMEFGNDCGNDIFQIRHQFQSTLSVDRNSLLQNADPFILFK